MKKRVLPICCVSMVCLSLLCVGCARFVPRDASVEEVDYGTPPTLSTLTASPNPASAGDVINLTTNYTDIEADLRDGLAAIAIEGKELSTQAFRANSQTGILTISFTVSHYTRPSDLRLSLKIRDHFGNWSNAVSTTLSVR